MDWNTLIQHSLLAGLIFSIVLTIPIIISLKINPEMWWQDYPKDVQQKWGPMSELAKKQRGIVAAIYFALIIGGITLATIRLGQLGSWESYFLAVLASTAIIIMFFNIWDAVIIDWLILLVLWPSLGILPGTEGMAGYHDTRWHVTNFFKGWIFVAVGSLITAGIALLLTVLA